MKKHIHLFTIAVLLILLQACGESDSGANSAKSSIAKLDTNSPSGSLMAVVESLKHNDVKSLMQISMSKADYDKAVAEFEKNKGTPSEANKAQFAQMMGMLTSEGAEDQIMSLMEPQLEQMRSQLPMMLMMGKGMASQVIQSSPDLPEGQKETVTKLATALIDFASENDLLSEEVTRKAVSAAVSTAKELDMASLDDLQNMSYDDVMGKASIVMGGAKNILSAYGISLDDLLSSVQVSDVQENGDNATMKLAYEFLGQTISQDVNMVKKDGKWTTVK